MSNILKCLEGYKNNLLFIKITNLKDLSTKKSSLQMNNNIIQISFSSEINFKNKIIRMITYIKKCKVILAKMNVTKNTSNRIQFFLNMFSQIKFSSDQQTKIFMIKINIIISRTKCLSNNSENTFNKVIKIIKRQFKHKS